MPLEYTQHGVFPAAHRKLKPRKIAYTVAWPDGSRSDVWQQKSSGFNWWHIARPGEPASSASHFDLIRDIADASGGRIERVR